MKTELSFLIDYLNKSGFWFVSNDEVQGDCTQEALNKGIIQPIENLKVFSYNEHGEKIKSHFYVPTSVKTKEDLCESMKNLFQI